MLSRSGFVLSLFCLLAGLLLAPTGAGAAGSSSDPPTLRILHTNDHHAQLEPLRINGQLQGGISRRKTLVDSLRADAAASGEVLLLLDAGDVFQGTDYFTRYLGQADLSFYNALGYDAMTVGNHEFDRGDQPLADFIAGANFPVLSANISAVAPSPLAGRVAPYTIIERGNLRIGIIGLTTVYTMWLSAPGRGVTFSDPLAATQTAVQELESQGVTVIVALVHLGISDELRLLRQVPAIDIMIGGHSHTRLGAGSSAGAYPMVVVRPGGSQAIYATAWEHGLLLGDVSVQLDVQGRVLDAHGEAHPVAATIAPDMEFEAQLAEYTRGLAVAKP